MSHRESNVGILVSLSILALALMSVLQPANWAKPRASEVTSTGISAGSRSSGIPSKMDAKLRRPVALGLIEDQSILLSTNERSGTVSCIRVSDGEVFLEQRVGTRPTDLVVLDEGKIFALVDFDEHRISTWRHENDKLVELHSAAVAQYPTKLVATSDDQSLIVASLWSRRLTFVERATDSSETLNVIQHMDLEFAPRELKLLSDDRHLFVADAFGGKLAIVDIETREVLRTVDVPGHNIRGLSTTPDETMLLVSHQMLNELAHTVRNDVHWGLLMSNDLRWLKIDSLLANEGNLFEGAHMHPLGQAGNAAGDPTGVTVTGEGNVVVALGGVDEVAIGREDDFSLDRIHVGKRPTAVIATHDGSTAFVANTFSDSISVIDVAEKQVVEELKLGPMPELSQADRGELLFHDARFSHDKWMSCQSCHTDGHTNGMLNDNFTDQSFGAPKRVLSLLGKADTLPLAWDGSVESFREQAKFSIKSTMQSDTEPDDESIDALAAYLETLKAPPALDVAREVVDRDLVLAGGSLFESLGCNSCHEPPFYTTPDSYDVGLVDEMGREKFNPPSLRGVSQRGPYFHDNRAQTLNEILEVYKHRLPRELTADELGSLVAFLRTL